MKRNTPSLAKTFKWLLDILLIIGILFLIGFPLILNSHLNIYKYYPSVEKQMYIILILTDLAIIFVIHELRKIYKTIIQETPFILKNVKSLYRMGIASFSLALVFFIKLFIFKTFLTYMMLLILIIAGCFSFTLSGLFQKAYEVKEENDLTI